VGCRMKIKMKLSNTDLAIILGMFRDARKAYELEPDEKDLRDRIRTAYRST
jgi:hypothetical protein